MQVCMLYCNWQLSKQGSLDEGGENKRAPPPLEVTCTPAAVASLTRSISSCQHEAKASTSAWHSSDLYTLQTAAGRAHVVVAVLPKDALSWGHACLQPPRPPSS